MFYKQRNINKNASNSWSFLVSLYGLQMKGNIVIEFIKLTVVLQGIADIEFGDIKDNSIDTFGDVYEYLISNYASNAGKSGGEYFTPQSVSKLLARIVMEGKERINKVYDPTCGFCFIIMTQANSQVKTRILEFLPKCKIKKMNCWCAV